MIEWTKQKYAHFDKNYAGHAKIIRFIISGGLATVVNLGALFTLTHFFHFWYLISAIIAFLFAFFVSFSLQKFWTFRDHSREGMHKQAGRFFVIVLLGLFINTSIIYVLVEFLHLHYLIAQFLSGIVIAFFNYMMYQKFIFHRKLEKMGPESFGNLFGGKSNTKSFFHIFLVLVSLGIFIFLSFSRLTESPPTWLDEGAIEQVAINLSDKGVYGYQTAPNHFISAGFLTTSYPVIYPVAMSFAIGGISLFNARIVMLFFMFILCTGAYFFIREQANTRIKHLSAISLLLLVTFAPFYGHGKNVLGEVPGIAFFIVSLFFLGLFNKSKRKEWIIFLAGIFSGFAMATKPIFLILILPSALLSILIIYRKAFSLKEKSLFFIGAGLPILLWLIVHVNSGSLFAVLFSGNPDHVSTLALFLENVSRFLKIEPFYFLCLMLVWWTSIICRKRADVAILTPEVFACLFSSLNFFSFFLTRGFYRYFFPGEVLALIFLPISLYFIFKTVSGRFPKFQADGAVYILLIFTAFQVYQTFFHSWISQSQNSHRAGLLSENLGALPSDKSLFVYNVPEALIFLPHRNFFQYLWFAESVEYGEENLPLLWKGVPDFLLIEPKFNESEKISHFYREKSRFDKYTLFEKVLK